MSDPAGLLLDRLLAEGRLVYLDSQDRGKLRVSGTIGADLAAEITAAKPALLALLEAEALHMEIARSAGDPFAEGATEGPVVMAAYSAWRVPQWVSPTGWVTFRTTAG